MFSVAMFVRPTRVTTVRLVLADDSRTTIEPLSSVTSPAQMLKATPAPAKTLVTTRDELVIWSTPRIRISADELEARSGRFTPTSLKRSVLVAFVGAQTLRLLMARLFAAVGPSMVTVLVPAFVT